MSQAGLARIGPANLPPSVPLQFTGDNGTIAVPVANNITIYADQVANNSGSSVSFFNAGAISTLNLTDSLSNTCLGKQAGSLTFSNTAAFNTCLGVQSGLSMVNSGGNTLAGALCGKSLVNGINNTGCGILALQNAECNEAVAIGRQSCEELTLSAQYITAVGSYSLFSATSGLYNTAIGHSSSSFLVTGSRNTTLGAFSGYDLNGTGNTIIGTRAYMGLPGGTGSFNIVIGDNAGDNYSGTESNNIIIGSFGNPGDNNTIRIGFSASQNRCFITGIAGVTVSNPVLTTINSSTGQLGVQALTQHNVLIGGASNALAFVSPSTTGTVLTSNGASADPSFTLLPASSSDALATMNSTVSNVTGDGTVYEPVIFDTSNFDVGSNYSTMTGLFTAPSTGKYLVTVSITFSGIGVAHTSGEVRVYVNASTFTRSSFNPFASAVGGLFTYCTSIVVSATSSQTIGVAAIVSGSTKTVGIQGNSFGNYSWMSVTLLGA